MQTRKQWVDYKKKYNIPDGAVKGVDLGAAIELCGKTVNSDDKKLPDKLKAVNLFRKTYTAYARGLGSDHKAKAKKFLETLGAELDEVEQKAFDAAANKADGKGAVVNLDPSDKTINDSSKSVADKRKLGDDKALRRVGVKDDVTDAKGHDAPVLQKDADFSKASSEPIVILAHGTPIGKPGSGKVRATHFANKKPGEIVDFIAKTLDTTYRGIVYLDGCYTAAGNSPQNFAHQVYNGLVKKGYHYLQIKGNLGLAITVDGKEFVVPAELEKKYDDLKAERDQLDKDIKALEKQYEDAQGKINRLIVAKLNGRKAEDLPDQEAKEHKGLLDKIEQVKATEKANAELKIEALTGTFGPERAAPR